jgi:outer membrane protein OmpA-like peptidoglycan-associated protein
MTRRNRRTPKGLAAALVATAISALAGGASAEPTMITGEPVPARELARMLYPLPTRSIVMEQPKPTPFGFQIQFEYNSAAVKPESRPYLDEVGKMMNLPQLTGKQVLIVGHADASGAETYNRKLSERRAEAVSQYLARYHGVGMDKLLVSGRGEMDPITEDPYDARNRRVQFHPVD